MPAGAGLPGHFMVLVEWERQPFFLDPFHEGRALTAGQCREFLMSLGYPFHERYLISAWAHSHLEPILCLPGALIQRPKNGRVYDFYLSVFHFIPRARR